MIREYQTPHPDPHVCIKRMYCTALGCTAPTALHCIILHYISLHFTTLHYFALYTCTFLYFIALNSTAQHNIALNCSTLNYTELHCTTLPALHCTALRYTTVHDTRLKLHVRHSTLSCASRHSVCQDFVFIATCKLTEVIILFRDCRQLGPEGSTI